MRDLTDLSYGWLTVIEQAENQGKHAAWKCKCRCGVEKTVRQDALVSGRVLSCGCRKKDPKVQSARVLNSVPKATRVRIAKQAGKARWEKPKQ